MDKRISRIERETAETNITVEFDVDGSGLAEVNTGIGFYDHMFNAFAKHGRFNLNIEAKGDLHVDAHHTMEDVAICVGQAINQSLGDRAGINRMASSIVPLDEALVQVVLDISGRPFSSILCKNNTFKVGDDVIFGYVSNWIIFKVYRYVGGDFNVVL